MAKNIKNIVVAVDFSYYTQPLLDYAFNMARRLRSAITVIHIINRKAIDCVKRQFETEHLEYFPYAEYVAREKKRCISKLEALVKNYQADDIDIAIQIEEGVPSVEILKFLNSGDSDFLVLGQKGTSDLPQFMSGSVSEKLFRYSPVPVLGLRFPKGQEGASGDL